MSDRQKIVSRFLRGDKFYTLPAKRNKLKVVLEYILDRFDQEKSYTEAEVNQIIGVLFDDFCRVRREFIDEKMMTRADGIYRRNNNYQSPGD